MTDITIAGSQEPLDYFEDIIRDMLLLFPITRAEAVGRLNRYWHGQEFRSDLSVNMLTHDLPEFWAKTIYYGPHATWWKGEDGLEPEPYP